MKVSASAAVSRANELLKKNNLTWADVIGGQNAPPPPPPPKGKRQREWEDVHDEAEIDMEIIPEALMDDDALIAYAERFLHEQTATSTTWAILPSCSR